MLHNKTPEKLKIPCTLLKAKKLKDKYGFEKIIASDEVETLFLLPQPVSDKATLEEYGVKYERSLQAAVFDDVEIRHFDFMKIYGEVYTIVGIKKYPSHRLLIMEKKHCEK